MWSSKLLAQPPIPDTATEPPGLVEEPNVVERAAILADRHFAGGGTKNGIFFDFGNVIPGAGWISGGPGYRHWFSRDRALFESSAAVSWHGYMVQARFEMPTLVHSRFSLGSEFRWQDFPQVTTFGIGPGSLETSISEYRLTSSNLVGYATYRPREWLFVKGDLGWLQPSIGQRRGMFRRNRPDARDIFPQDIVFALEDQPAFVHSGASIVADTRDFPGHPTSGGVLRAAATQYADRADGLFSFRRYEAEAAGFVPLADSRVVVAVRGWLLSTDPSAGAVVPFYLMPSLGGSTTLRSFRDYRFHDRNLLLLNTELRVALMTHVDVAGFVDAGNVAPRVGDLNLDKRSYGAGLRFHTRRQTLARLDVAHGAEGWSVAVRLTDPLSLGRIGRRTAAVPFVP